MIHTTKDGEIFEYEDIKVDSDNSFKVNLPLTEEDFLSGNGEGVWGCVSKLDNNKINACMKGVYLIKILNDSIYYPNLKYGAVVMCKYDGINRPVAIKSELDFHYGECISIEERMDIIRKISGLK